MEVRSQGEDWGWLHEHSLKGASAPQLAERESGKKSGPAGEARDHCFWVHKERRFRTTPKQAPEMAEHCLSKLQRQGQATDIILDSRGGHRLLELLLLPPRILCASTGHYPPPPGSLYSTPLPRSHDPGPTP